MNIAIIAPGQMGAAVGKRLSHNGLKVVTSLEGRSRDSAWFSIVDSEWPAIRSGFEQWLSPANFDAAGNQVEPLSALIAQSRA